MASMINTNISSLNAQRNLSTSKTSLETSLQRLSTGLRINSAKDDAAGMAISTRMTSQINGLNQATRNANDGISLTQTAEAGMASATDLLQRMRDLAVQSSNGSNSDTDRAAIQTEVGQLKEEIDRVAKSTNFNGLNLLDGSFSAQSFQVGANNSSNDRIQIKEIANLQTTKLGSGTTGSSSLTSGLTTKALAAGDLTLNGTQIGASTAGAQAGQSSSSAYAVAQAINAAAGQSGVTATANATVATSITHTGAAAKDETEAAKKVAANTFSINGVNIGEIEGGKVFGGTTNPPTAGGSSAVFDKGTKVADAINKVKDQTGVMATVDDAGKVMLTSTNGKDIELKMVDTATGAAASLLDSTGLAPTNAAADSSDGTAPTAGAYAAGAFKINGVEVGAIADGGTASGQGANTAAAINAVSDKTGVTAKADSVTGKITLSAADGRDIKLEDGGTAGRALAATGIAPDTFTGTVTLSSSNVNGIVVGGKNNASAGLKAYTGLKAADTKSTGTISSVDVSTATGAQAAIDTIDKALSSVNTSRANMGAYQNRFSAVVSNLQSSSESLSSSRSRIQDADFAAETASMTRGQILQQAGTAMLAQANSLPNGVLSLLRG
ncbi:flagellin N-terminal helical domain-containing protein [Massilia brevitalea]|uniref:flagellin N-terminal helical domain-containing protein n=1 Tax=Massilia brevitalea TaxID=442526 RepID=UPI00273A1556|nr:flagellin [Massilia brevitalea]